MQNKPNIDFYLIKSDDYYNTVPVKIDTRVVYKEMLLIREMELLLDDLFQKNQIQGFCHLVVGQEAIYVALKAVLNGDKVIGSYRCHGLAFASGIPVQEIVCEMIGKANGNCKGKGGSMHLYNDVFYGGHGIVGAQVPLGTGLAYALKYKSKEGVCFTFFGDGAANQGQVYESFNMAKLWNLPIVFVCENNFFGMWTPESNVTTYSEYYKRGFNIPGIRINGNDIEELLRAFTFSKEFAQSNGPIIVEIDTYRTCGHSCVDKSNFYRDQAEVDRKKAQDGLVKARNCLLKETSKGIVLDIEEEVKESISNVKEYALNSEDPPKSELFSDILSE